MLKNKWFLHKHFTLLRPQYSVADHTTLSQSNGVGLGMHGLFRPPWNIPDHTSLTLQICCKKCSELVATATYFCPKIRNNHEPIKPRANYCNSHAWSECISSTLLTVSYHHVLWFKFVQQASLAADLSLKPGNETQSLTLTVIFEESRFESLMFSRG